MDSTSQQKANPLPPVEQSESTTPSAAFLAAKKPLLSFQTLPHGLRVLFLSDSTSLTNAFEIMVPVVNRDHSGLPTAARYMFGSGSKKYPDKRYYNELRAMCTNDILLSDTSSNRTNYHFTTLNFEELMAFAPVFFDHAMNPLLSEEEFAQIVYDGHGGGAMYTAALDLEWKSKVHLFHQLYQLVPAEVSAPGYQWCNRGATPAIEQLTVEHLRKFHEYWYRNENVQIDY